MANNCVSESSFWQPRKHQDLYAKQNTGNASEQSTDGSSLGDTNKKSKQRTKTKQFSDIHRVDKSDTANADPIMNNTDTFEENTRLTMETTNATLLKVKKDPLPLDFVLDDLKNLTSQVAYFYLRNEIGLSEDAMWKITVEASSALGMTAGTIRGKIDVLRSTMDLSDDDIRLVLERHPSVLHLSAEKNVAPKILFLVRALDLSKSDLRQLFITQPAILSYSRSNLQQKLKFFTTNLLGFSVDECRHLLLSEPKLLTASVKGGLLPRARFLLKEIQIPRKKLRDILKKNPRILLYSLDQNLIPKLINYCIMTLHMDPGKDVVRLLSNYPQIMDYNLERHILPITRYILTELEFSAHEMRTILLKCPRLMTYSLSKIKHVVGYLRYELGFDADGVRRVLYQTPQTMGLDMETNITPKLSFLHEIFGFSDLQQVRQLVLGMPSVLNLSVEKNLGPKIEYLQSVISSSDGRNANDQERQRILRDMILRMPALLGYSLEKRIRPRLECIVNAGLPAASITVGIPMKEYNFQRWLQKRQQEKAQSAIILSQPILPPQQTEEEDRDRSSRIVHWTRKR